MSGDLLRAVEDAAVSFAAEAGVRLTRYFQQHLVVEFKNREHTDPVTAADREVEAFVAGAIRERFPHHHVLGEEGTADAPRCEWLWVIDPLDGTTNFTNRLPIFACSIGVLYQGWPVVGAIWLPGLVELGGGVYYARRGGGAFWNGQPLRAAPETEPTPARLAALPAFHWRRFHLGGKLTRQPGEVRGLGSIAHELALIAAGTLQYGLYKQPKIWDVAGGILIVREAGGQVSQWTGWRRRWQPFERFQPARTSGRAPRGLRDWARNLLVSGAPMHRFLQREICPVVRLGDLWRGAFGITLTSTLWRPHA
ncbi:MAG: hypothetical protein HYY04_01115 [Chloroflexi bacterium]|nr:hypothetical protein [Chloroflexota bacterium]